MRKTLLVVADLLDVAAALAAIGATYFFVVNFASVKTGPEFMQIGLFSLAVAIIPYCLAGAIHRLVSRPDF